MTETAAAAAESSAPAPDKSESRWWWILLGLYFATRIPWLFTVPMVEAPDEFAHFWVIKFLLEHGRLPEAAEVFAGGPSAVYGSLPQLGYIPHVATGLLGKALPFFDLSVTERFGSLVSGVVLVWCAVQFGQRLFSDNKLMRLALPVMVVFHPQLVLVHSYANSDAVTASLSALAMLGVCNMMDKGMLLWRSLLVGLLLGWAVLTKYTGLAAYPACAIGLIAAGLIRKNGIGKIITHGVIAGAMAGITCLWWFIRTATIFPGDVLGTQTMFNTWAVTYHKSLHPDISVMEVIKQKPFWRFTFFSFWGLFGYVTRYLWRPLYFVYLGFMLVSIAGGITALVRTLKSKVDLPAFANPGTPEQIEAAKKSAIWLMLATCFATNLSMMIYAATKNLGGGQGRYLFPSEIPIIALLLGGLHLFGKPADKPLVIGLVAFTIAVYFGASLWLLPMYGFHFLKNY